MKYRCAILDDYQNVALSYADWSSLAPEVDIKVSNQPFKGTEDVHRSLQGFQIICMMLVHGVPAQHAGGPARRS
jgi:D-3-phosphoglycerate dehydrogenase